MFALNYLMTFFTGTRPLCTVQLELGIPKIGVGRKMINDKLNYLDTSHYVEGPYYMVPGTHGAT